MVLAGKSVAFRVTDEGDRALGNVFSGKTSFAAYVLAQDEVGVWITFGARPGEQAVPLILLKWQYIATVAFDFLPENEPARARPGFRRTDSD